jgi:hypothetical protein
VVVDGVPSAERFRAVVGGVLTLAAARGRLVRAFGEAVDVLAARGEYTAAIQLEDLWNRAALQHHFALLCGYSVDRFRDPDRCGPFEQICGRHNRVLAAGAHA